MEAIIIATLLSIITLIHFVGSFRSERLRQRMITWPRVSAHFKDQMILLKPHDESVWLAQLQEPYQFYLRGELFSGNKLLLGDRKLNDGERREVTRRLNHKRGALTVAYNPADPTENTLLVPHIYLSWFSLLLFLVFGMVLPLTFQTDSYSYLPVFAFYLMVIVTGFYIMVRSDRHLKDLIPG